MSALKLIEDIHAHGGTLELTDGKLIARNIPAGMLKQLRSVKPEVMALLAANDEPSSTTIITGNHVADSDGTSCCFRTNEGALEYARLVEAGEQDAFDMASRYEDALEALAACGWTGVSAVNVARAISAGVTDETVLTAMLEVNHD